MRKCDKEERLRKAHEVRSIDDMKSLYDDISGVWRENHPDGPCFSDFFTDDDEYATMALALAGAHLAENIIGSQASISRLFLGEWSGTGRRTSFHIVDYDLLIWPQYLKYFDGMRIKLEDWQALQRACAEELNQLDTTDFSYGYEHTRMALRDTREYWGKICAGWIPSEIHVRDLVRDIPSVAPICVTRPTHTFADIEREQQCKETLDQIEADM